MRMRKPLNTVWRSAKNPIGILVLAVLVACGGGKTSNFSNSVASSATVSGVASKGWIKNGIATAYAVVNGSKGGVLASARTNSQGEYTLIGIPTGSLILVEITGDANTKMVDETSNADISLPSTFSLRAVTQLESGTQVSSATLQVTPFSEMAVAQASRRSGGLTASNAATANAEMRQTLGFDVFSEKPTFSENGQAPTNAAALALAAVSRLANDGARGCGTGDVADKVVCVVQSMAAAGTSDATLITELNDAVTEAASDESFDGIQPPAATVVAEGSPGLTDTQLSGIVQAKALIASLRNSAELTGDGPNSVSARRAAIEQALSQATQPFSSGPSNILLAVMQAANEMAVSDDSKFSGYMAYGSAQCYYAAQLPSTEDLAVALNEPSDWQDVAGAVCLNFVGTDAQDHYRWQEVIVTKPSSGSAYRVASRMATYDAEGTLLSTQGSFFGSDQRIATATPQLLNGQANNLSLTGNVIPLTTDPITPDYDYLNVAINATPSVAANPLVSRIAITGVFKVMNAASVAVNTLGLKAGSYMEVKTESPGILSADFSRLPNNMIDNSLSKAHLLITMQLNTGEGLDGILDASDVKVDATGNRDAPTAVSFEGQYKDAISTLFDGKATVTLLNVPQVDMSAANTASNFVKTTATLLGKIAGSAGVLANVNLSFNHATDYTVQTLTGSLKKTGTEALLLNATRNPAVSDSATLTLSTATGVSMVLGNLSDKTTPRDIMKDGVVVGQYDPDKATVYYADQTSESY